ncbi:hypothetical protein [Sphingobacterium hotanense]|uniref:hypothetical protein n=1 Tax=Sphingobacterium hotanense TaxID=649196 RepID=UPI0011F276E9|nr:hypothetical protein [Sphingobacterium hotanense]
MKNILQYLLALFLMVCSACSKSDDTGNPTIPGGGASSSSYWPLAVGNTWNLVNLNDPEDKSVYLLHKTVEHSGKTYFQIKPVGTNAKVELTNGIREEDGIFYELHGATSAMGVNTSAGVITSINTKLPVGATWKEDLTITVSGMASGTIKHSNEGKILAKSSSESIQGKTYKDVIKVETKKTVRNSISGQSLTLVYETWLCKSVGIIYEKTTYNGTHADQYQLVNYVLK